MRREEILDPFFEESINFLQYTLTGDKILLCFSVKNSYWYFDYGSLLIYDFKQWQMDGKLPSETNS